MPDRPFGVGLFRGIGQVRPLPPPWAFVCTAVIGGLVIENLAGLCRGSGWRACSVGGQTPGGAGGGPGEAGTFWLPGGQAAGVAAGFGSGDATAPPCTRPPRPGGGHLLLSRLRGSACRSGTRTTRDVFRRLAEVSRSTSSDGWEACRRRCVTRARLAARFHLPGGSHRGECTCPPARASSEHRRQALHLPSGYGVTMGHRVGLTARRSCWDGCRTRSGSGSSFRGVAAV